MSAGRRCSANPSVAFFGRQFERQIAASDFALNPFEEMALPLLQGEVLDLGCGLGNLSLAAAAQGAKVTALDACANAVESLRRRAGIAAVHEAVRPGGVAVVNVLVEGSTYEAMFGGGERYLFGEAEAREAFAGWEILREVRSEFPAPGGTVKRFETVAARRP